MVPKIRFNTRTRVAPHRALPPLSGGGDAMAGALRAPPPRAGRRAALARFARGLASLQTQPTNTNQNTSRPRVGRLGNIPRRAACASHACGDRRVCAAMVGRRWLSRGGGREGARAPLSLPAPCSTKGWRAGPTPHTRTHQCRTTMHPTATNSTNAEPNTSRPTTSTDRRESIVWPSPFALGSLASSTH